jgi:hypothetical protein
MIAVRVLPVIAELELGNIQRHLFSAHFVERADHARQALNRISPDPPGCNWTDGGGGFVAGCFNAENAHGSPSRSPFQTGFLVARNFDGTPRARLPAAGTEPDERRDP